MEDIENQCPPLDLARDGEIPEFEGGELTVYEKTKQNEVGRSLSVYASESVQELTMFLAITATQPEGPPIPILHGSIWQSVRDMCSSLFLALCGHYRQTNLCLRGVIENVAFGLAFRGGEDSTDRDFERYFNGKDNLEPKVVKEIFEDVGVPKAEDVKEEIGRLYGKPSQRLHSMRDGDIHRVMSGDKESPALPWTRYYDVDQMRDWFDSFIKLAMFVGYTSSTFLLDEETTARGPIIPEIYERATEGELPLIDSDGVIEL